MPKETRVPLCVGSSSSSPYHSTTKTNKIKKKRMLRKVAKSKSIAVVYKKVKEAKCSICKESPHNGVILQCSNVEKGCRAYTCNTSFPLSNCLNKFLESPASTSCPLCGGEVGGNKWINVKGATLRFMNSIPRSCAVETCEFTGNYAELENHASLEHPSLRPSVVDKDLIALRNDFERVVAVKEGHHQGLDCRALASIRFTLNKCVLSICDCSPALASVLHLETLILLKLRATIVGYWKRNGSIPVTEMGVL